MTGAIDRLCADGRELTALCHVVADAIAHRGGDEDVAAMIRHAARLCERMLDEVEALATSSGGAGEAACASTSGRAP